MNLFDSENVRMLISALLALENEEQCRYFLEDILTSRELVSISQRLAVAKLLCENEKYTAVAQKTGASSATIVRVNHCVQYGSGGYRSVLEKLGYPGGGQNDSA